MLIDSHCHLHDREFFADKQAEEMIRRAHEADVKKIVCIGTSHEDSLSARDFANNHPDVYWTYGIHPESAGKENGNIPQKLLDEAISTNDVVHSDEAKAGDMKPEDRPRSDLVAIGEVGLDYHYEGYNREAQIRLFEEMLQLAKDNRLPVVFHVREAFADFFPVVANFPDVKGVVHSFTDSKKILRRILNETDYLIGVNGLATYSTLPLPPLERIMLETDAPFLAPVPHRGEQNEPAYILNIAEWLAKKIGDTLKRVTEVTTGNTIKLFGL